jgi:hypothetical protein
MNEEGQRFTHCPFCKTGGGLQGTNLYRCSQCQQCCCGFCVKQRAFLGFFQIGFSCPHCQAPLQLDTDKIGFIKGQTM